MRYMKTLLTVSLMTGLTVLAGCSGGQQAEVTPPAPKVETPASVSLADVIAHPRRDSDKARDQFRHPKETLEFFEVGPGKSVAEIYPGWYSEILAPYLKENNGRYYAVLFPEGRNANFDREIAAYKEKYSNKEIYGDVGFGSMSRGSGAILPPESVDVVLTFRNVHNWMKGGYADDSFNEFYAALKPGGILGVVEHRLPETATQNPKALSGYVQESFMKDMAARAGFEFVASSEVNANPRDTADHPLGVWTLPPSSRSPDAGSEQAKGFNPELFKNIGESDRATLKFRKPL